MALGITREELNQWKAAVQRGEMAFLTHYWLDERFPGINTVTKAGCSDRDRLTQWCISNGLNPIYIHHREQYPHYDLIGAKQLEILQLEGLTSHIKRFKLGQ